MSRSATFNPKVVLGLVLFGALAFFATLYFIGSGQTGQDVNNGNAHAAAKGLNGYAALVQLLEKDGHEVSLSRSQGSMDDESLLVLTPPAYADADDIKQIINDRRYVGPTMIIIPKWMAFPASNIAGVEAEEGWVALAGSIEPDWPEDLGYDIKLQKYDKQTGWRGLGLRGPLPDPEKSIGAESSQIVSLVTANNGATLAGYLDDGDAYPMLEEAAQTVVNPNAEVDRWAVMFVFEADLINNYGFASENRAWVAHELVDLAMEGEDLPIVFDLTLNGLGSAQNLLTLAFRPPFLAATLCLILALIVIGWRAFRRFGPPVAEGRSIAFGKTRLIKNSAGLIQRAGRLHLLSGPYADMLRARIVTALALRKPDDADIDAAIARRSPDIQPYSSASAELRSAQTPKDILRAAAALKSIERMLSK